jgi:hypothetical protein
MAKKKEKESTAPEADFLLVSFEAGKIDAAVFFRAPETDGYRGAKTRAEVAGVKKFHVYRISGDENSPLALTWVEK